MSKHDALLRSLIEPLLDAGEQLIGHAVVNYNGTLKAANLPRGANKAAGDPDAAVEFPTARQMALGLTRSRLLVFNLGFSGKPKQHIGDVPLRAIDDVDLADTRFGGVNLRMRSGAKVALEFLPGERGDTFSSQLDELVERPAAIAPSDQDLPSWDPQPAGEQEAAGATRPDDDLRPLPPVMMAGPPPAEDAPVAPSPAPAPPAATPPVADAPPPPPVDDALPPPPPPDDGAPPPPPPPPPG